MRKGGVIVHVSMIDSHCHLADPAFFGDLPAVLARAEELGVTRMISIADDLDEAERCSALAEQYHQIFATVGVHPHNAKTWKEVDSERLSCLVRGSPRVRAVGEIGLDYHYDNSPREVQRAVFAKQLMISIELNKPVVIHCRRAIDDLLMIVMDTPPKGAVLHCCTEKWEDVRSFIERGYLLGFTGIATYPRSQEIRETIRQCPLERILIETDAPYLAPQGYRGKRCEPSHIIHIAKLIAQIKGVGLEEVDRITAQNAIAFYDLP